MLQYAAESPASSAPWNDGGQSFSTRERLAVSAEDTPKVMGFQEKGAFFAISGRRSENAVLGRFVDTKV